MSDLKLRPEVEKFSATMECVLRDNDHKGGWDDCDLSWLYKRLKEEVEELGEVLLSGDERAITKEAADVANFAMMIASNVNNI